MDHMSDKKTDHFLPQADRPIECGGCRKPIAVRYTEIIGGVVTQTNMCADCPELQSRLHGLTAAEQAYFQSGQAALECGNCGTTLEEVKRGHRLGCMECYDVFDNLILSELQNSDKVPTRALAHLKKSHLVHIGRAPGEILAINPSSRLLALNEALKEMLNREDYEQAAWLRDQIRDLTENREISESGGPADERSK